MKQLQGENSASRIFICKRTTDQRKQHKRSLKEKAKTTCYLDCLTSALKIFISKIVNLGAAYALFTFSSILSFCLSFFLFYVLVFFILPKVTASGG